MKKGEIVVCSIVFFTKKFGYFLKKPYLCTRKTKTRPNAASIREQGNGVRHIMGKSYTASSFGIPPGLDRSKGTRL